MSFNPDQPRDYHGRWGGGGSGNNPAHAGGHANSVPKLPRGTVAAYAGRDVQGRTYTQAINDHSRFPKQNPNLPNAADYKTPSSADAAAKSTFYLNAFTKILKAK